MSTLLGAPQLEARLSRLSQVGTGLKKAWAGEAAKRIRGSIPIKSGHTAASVQATSDAVRGSHVVSILDAGARAHVEEARNASVMRFSEGGNTIFAPRVLHPGIRGEGFIAKDAKGAMQKVGKDAIVSAWNGR